MHFVKILYDWLSADDGCIDRGECGAKSLSLYRKEGPVRPHQYGYDSLLVPW